MQKSQRGWTGKEGSAGHGQRLVCGCSLLRRSRLRGLRASTLQRWRKQAHQPLVLASGQREGLRSASSSLPQKHSRRLGTRVLVAAPADGLGPLPVVAQVPLDQVVVSSAPAAVLGELDP